MAIDTGTLIKDLRLRQHGPRAERAALEVARRYALAERVGNDLRNELYDALQAQSFQFYDRAQSGQLMSRATDDINNIRGMMMFALRAIVQTVGDVLHAADQWAAEPATVEEVLDAQRWAKDRARRAVEGSAAEKSTRKGLVTK